MNDFYSNNLLIRPLLQLIPLGSAADVAVMQLIDKHRNERIDYLETKLKGLSNVISKRHYNREYIVDLYFKAARYAQETQQKQKIGLLANCLVNSDSVKSDKDYDLYEFGLNIIGQMTIIELEVLSIIYKLRGVVGLNNHREPQWKGVVETIVADLKITAGEVKAISNILEAKGLIVDFPSGMFPASGFVESTGRVSEIGARIIGQIQLNEASD